MFQGRWPNPLTLDAKKRLALPARIRDGLSGPEGLKEVMVGVLQEKCLYLHSPEQHARFLERTFRHLGDTRDSRKLKTFILSRFVPVNSDSQGRMTLPQFLLDLAAIKKDVVLLSQDARIEVWGAEPFQALEVEAEANFDEAMEVVFAKEHEEQLRRAQSPAGEGG